VATISGLINTRNEADNIEAAVRCLRPWCDEVIVVDQESSDGTPDIARALGVTVISTPATGFVEPARKVAFEHSTGDWIYILDADELVPATLARELRRIAESGETDVVMVPVRHVVLGQWFQHGRWWPGHKAKLFRRESLRLTNRIHRGVLWRKRSRVLRLPPVPEFTLWHLSYHSISDLVEKTNRYTTYHAIARRASGRGEPRPKDVVYAFVRRLWRDYISARGYRAGMAGLTVGLTNAFYDMLEMAKRWDEPRVAARLDDYDRIRADLLSGWADGEVDGPDAGAGGSLGPDPDGSAVSPSGTVSGSGTGAASPP
jgi:glycosyltransferase involved in cell wall biosynthesis